MIRASSVHQLHVRQKEVTIAPHRMSAYSIAYPVSKFEKDDQDPTTTKVVASQHSYINPPRKLISTSISHHGYLSRH